MIKKIGRLVMLAIAITLVVFSVYRIIDDFAILRDNFGSNWQEIFRRFFSGDFHDLGPAVDFLWRILYIIVGLTALAVAISGHSGLWSTIAAGLMLGFFITNIVLQVRAGTFNFQEYILTLSLDVVLQLIYITGLILVKYGNHRENRELREFRKYKKNH